MKAYSSSLFLAVVVLGAIPQAAAQTDVWKCVAIAPADTRRNIYQDKPCEANGLQEASPVPVESDLAGEAAVAPTESDQARKAAKVIKPSRQKFSSASSKKNVPVAGDLDQPKNGAGTSGVFRLFAAVIGLGLVGWTVRRLATRKKRRESSGAFRREPRITAKNSLPAPKPIVFVEPKKAEAPERWDINLLMEIEWRRFEELCELLLKADGYAARNSGKGADGGIDLVVPDKLDPNKTFAIAQCKAWTQQVGVEAVRALWGCKDHFAAQTAIFYSRSGFTDPAVEFSRGKELKLISGREILEAIDKLPREDQVAMLKQVTRGDYTTPSCPNCEIKMVRRIGARNEFWGCPNYSKCGSRGIPIAAQHKN